MSPPTPITIDLATPANQNEVIELLTHQLTEHNIHLPPTELANGVQGMLANEHRGRILLARKGPKPLGIAVLAYTWTLEHGGKSSWLDELYVDPATRNQGLGKNLLQAALHQAKKDGCIAMELEVEQSHARATNLYLREGFQPHTRARYTRKLNQP